MNDPHGGRRRFRVWICGSEDCQPGEGREMHTEKVAIEPAEEGVMSHAEAADYLEAFNAAACARGGRIRAVAVPVTVRYQGDAVPGQRIAEIVRMAQEQEKDPPPVC